MRPVESKGAVHLLSPPKCANFWYKSSFLALIASLLLTLHQSVTYSVSISNLLLTTVVLDYKCDSYNLIKPTGLNSQDSKFFSYELYVLQHLSWCLISAERLNINGKNIAENGITFRGLHCLPRPLDPCGTALRPPLPPFILVPYLFVALPFK